VVPERVLRGESSSCPVARPREVKGILSYLPAVGQQQLKHAQAHGKDWANCLEINHAVRVRQITMQMNRRTIADSVSGVRFQYTLHVLTLVRKI
jgi:hypothetical protein